MNEFELFQSALDIDDLAARKLFLNSACEQNAEMLNRVESLLASHEGESRFLQSPVVEQLGDDLAGRTAATLVMGTGSTQDEEPRGDASAASILEFSPNQERIKMADEVPLGYLEPSTKPGSLGRLAHYEILEVVGSGAFGTVLRAFDDKLQRVVAIKVMAPELASTSPARKRFIREAQASAAIRHENVVSVYSVEEKPIPYLVMEYIPGMNLQQRLDERGPLDVVTVLRMGTQIAEGLAAAHAKDLIHRDIKPGNILLESGMRDRVKITDFGLARAADDASMTQSGTIAGTPMYMAPEQALGHKLDQRADLFSFGSVLYQMVSGRPPFRASSTLAVLKRLTEDTPRPIREIIPETPAWLCDIIAKLHAKYPDERYQSAREIADVLANCESQLKEHSRLKDLSLIPRAKPQPAGWWKWVAVAALVLPLLAVGWYAVTRPASQPKVVEKGNSGSSSPEPTPVSAAKQETPPPAIAPFDAAQAKAHQKAWAKHLGVPIEHTNSIGMKFVLIPPGEFLMGSPAAELEQTLQGLADDPNDILRVRVRAGAPQHRVMLTQPRYLSIHEVTQAQYEQVMGKNPAHYAAMGAGKDAVAGMDTANHPVEMVSRLDAVGFCLELGKREKLKPFYLETDKSEMQQDGTGYRLPTEAEWEFACRAGTVTSYATGDQESDLVRAGWFVANSGGRTHAAGELQANPFGLHDMHGNVWEWIQDWSDYAYYQQLPKNLIVDPMGPASSNTTERGLRGGKFDCPAFRCRSSNRDANIPTAGASDIGFRVSLPVDAVKAAIANRNPPSTQERLPPTYTNSLKMEFVIVPEGKSWLGGSKDKLGDREVEIPADFYLGKYEVTQEEWEKVMGENPSHFSRTGSRKDLVKDITDEDLKRFPVEVVSWDQCQVFVAKLNKLEKETGWVYRLPTEMEWEYACRGGPMADKADSAFNFYLARPTNTPLPEQANTNDGKLKRTCKVGSYAPNVLGLHDMHGNVWEWCDDIVKLDEGPSRRMARGGSCLDDSWHCRAARPHPLLPSHLDVNIGLRLARVPSGAASPEAKTPPLAANVLNDAVLLMNFEKDTFYEKDGKTYVRDLSGRGNDGDCEDVSFTPDGKAGGGLACQGGALRIPNSLIHGQANYTITGWCRSDAIAPPTDHNLYESASERSAILFNVRVNGERSVRVNAWNKDKDPTNWLDNFTKDGVVPDQGWYFFAVSMRDGGVGTGTLRVTVDQATYSLEFQMVKNPDVVVSDLIGRKMSGAVIDELTVFQRALTDQEIAAVRALGLKSTPLNVSKVPPIVKQEPLPPTHKNSIGMEFVIVPKGKSWLGGGKDRLGDKELEIPADFYLGKYEVTQEEWEKVMGENPSWFSRTGGDSNAVKDISDADLKRFPVENVSWDQCQIFVAKLNKLEKETGWVYRLPKEAEWEYACRGGPMSDKLDSAFDFYFAKPTNTVLPDQANFEHGNGLKRTCKVDSYEPNVLGLYDMHGNVWQWCDDNEKASDGTSRRVGRGGGWAHAWGNCRAAYRFADPPSSQQNFVGLRLARVPSGTPSPEVKMPTAIAPLPDADIKRIAALPAAEQVEEVRKELMRRNPGFDGKFEHKIADGVVTEFGINTDQLTDITPIRVWSSLRVLKLFAPKVGGADLVHLKDCKELTELWLGGLKKVSDAGLAHFKDCKNLTELHLEATQMSDVGLAHMKDCKRLGLLDLGATQVSDAGLVHLRDFKALTQLRLGNTQVTDAGLSHLKGLPLMALWIDHTGITDLTPLQDMPLEDIRLSPKNIVKGLDILRGMKSLKTIGIAYYQAWPAAEFWERYDKGEFKE